jgi:acetoin utilization deacetylase AcuC-like enzyme
VQAFYCDHFVLPLPPDHRFPMAKYSRLRERVAAELPGVRLVEPPAASAAVLGRVHDADYVERVMRDGLNRSEIRAIGFPWSAAMVERACRSVGATLAACDAAQIEGVAVNLAGGTHHAYRDRGQGYCVFNDVAVAARQLQAAAGRPQRVVIVDLDVHQGNGTASIFAGDNSVFTLSLHGAGNFPFRKELSDLDVALPDGTGDAEYLDALEQALEQMAARFDPEFLFYVAGADAHAEDRLGKLSLSTAGMRGRDERVFALARALRLPLVVTMAGGYGRQLDTTVAVHFNTVAAAFAEWSARNHRAIDAGA